MSNPLPPPPPQYHHQSPYITTPTTATNREYLKGNWTIQETLTLITAKRLDDERRARPSRSSVSKPGELRWKWIENYCWDHGCFRSQNQCNDKWDNLRRDYKKVRQYQSSPQQTQSPHHSVSYLSMDRHQRKLHKLPTNMSPEVFEALNHVLQRKYTTHQQQPSVSQSTEQLAVKSARKVPEIETPVTVSESKCFTCDGTEETESGENLGSETKGKKVRKLGSNIKRSASVLAPTLKCCEENKEKRHQEMMEVEHRRLQIEETQNRGMRDVVAAVTNLTGAIQSLVAQRDCICRLCLILSLIMILLA
ncbi:hypothetical protein V6N13_111802 [Hibiscus sabdariffa]|uniref:Myb-like domain-containing protein n=1 Tax=Hibiscus sabdariffa TaxID=183260 RepID=A0ABR2TLV3_9ROSI